MSRFGRRALDKWLSDIDEGFDMVSREDRDMRAIQETSMKDAMDPMWNNYDESDGHVIVRNSIATYGTVLAVNRNLAKKWKRRKVISSRRSLIVAGMVDGHMVCVANVQIPTSWTRADDMEEALKIISEARNNMCQHFKDSGCYTIVGDLNCNPPASTGWPEQWQQYQGPRDLLLGEWREDEDPQAPLITDHTQENLAEGCSFLSRNGMQRHYDQMYASDQLARVGVLRAARPGSDHSQVMSQRCAESRALVQFTGPQGQSFEDGLQHEKMFRFSVDIGPLGGPKPGPRSRAASSRLPEGCACPEGIGASAVHGLGKLKALASRLELATIIAGERRRIGRAAWRLKRHMCAQRTQHRGFMCGGRTGRERDVVSGLKSRRGEWGGGS